MQIVVVGINQNSAPVAVREQLAGDAAGLPAWLAGLQSVAAEGFLLATCNRVEAYILAGHAETGAANLAQFLAASRGLAPATLRPHLYTHAHTDAVRHLFSVAAGLDSMVLGEDQILAQVKGALDHAQAAGTLGPALHRLGHAALATGKQVRTGTGLGRHHLSVVSVGLHQATEQLGDLRRRAVLLLGAGRTAELTLKHLTGAGPARVTLVNRSAHRAEALAARYGAVALPWDGLESALQDADLVIGCTAAPGPVVSAGAVARAMAERPACPLLCLDLGVPRNIDPAVAGLPGVTLVDLDHVQARCTTNREQRGQEVVHAQAIVAAAVDRYMAWWQARAVAPTITALRDHADGIRAAEVARALARMPGLSAQEQAAVEYLAEALVNKLLHTPVTALKTLPEGGNMAQVVQQLFGLAPAPPAAPYHYAGD